MPPCQSASNLYRVPRSNAAAGQFQGATFQETHTMNTIASRAEWLDVRQNGIGGSDAAAIVGLSRWKSNVTLWEEKTGRRKPDDISDEEAVARGIREEPGIRALFASMHPEWMVHYREFDLVRNPQEPWRFATLDGRLYAVDADRRLGYQNPYGVLEIKSVEPRGRAAWAEWNGRVPSYYLAQALHQMGATGARFAVLVAFLHSLDTATGRTGEMREYMFDREDYGEQIEWLAEREREFWRCVEADEEPPTILPSI